MQTPPEEYEGVVLGSVESGKYIAGLKRRREFEPSLLNENMSEIPVPITPVSRPKYNPKREGSVCPTRHSYESRFAETACPIS